MAATSLPLKILIVDDELPILEVLSAFLREAGHEVETASDGRVALLKYTSQSWDVVMTDRIMPQMDGEMLADAIKKLNPAQSIIMVTGSAEVFPHRKESCSINLVIRKPFTRETIRAGLASVLAEVSTKLGETLA